MASLSCAVFAQADPDVGVSSKFDTNMYVRDRQIPLRSNAPNMGDGERSRHRDKERSHKHRHKHDDDRHHHRRKRRRDDDHNDRDTNKPVKTEEREEKSLADQFDEDMWEEKPQETEPKLERQSWMTEDKADSKSDPFSSFLGGAKKEKKPIEKPPEQPKISSRELNPGYLDPPSPPSKAQDDKYTPPNYTIGDDGSSWRMMKLKNLYTAAKEKMIPVEELAVERMGSLQAFDEAREEEMELERRKRDRRGEGVMKVKVTGELYQQRLAKQKKQTRQEPQKKQPAKASSRYRLPTDNSIRFKQTPSCSSPSRNDKFLRTSQNSNKNTPQQSKNSTHNPLSRK